MKSKVLSLILAVCTLCSLLVSPASAVGGDSAVQMVQALGILDGTDLESPVTRAEFSKMLVAASSYKDSVSSEGSGYSLFRDVKSSSWASEYIRCAVSEGWMTGYTDGTFRPDAPLTRAAAATILYRVMQAKGLGLGTENPGLLQAYPDGSAVPSYARGAMSVLLQAGILTGTSAGKLEPGRIMTRAEMAVVLARALTY